MSMYIWGRLSRSQELANRILHRKPRVAFGCKANWWLCSMPCLFVFWMTLIQRCLALESIKLCLSLYICAGGSLKFVLGVLLNVVLFVQRVRGLECVVFFSAVLLVLLVVRMCVCVCLLRCVFLALASRFHAGEYGSKAEQLLGFSNTTAKVIRRCTGRVHHGTLCVLLACCSLGSLLATWLWQTGL